jgi:sortase A
MSVYRDFPLGVECALPRVTDGSKTRKRPWIAWIAAPLVLAGALLFGGQVFGIGVRRAAPGPWTDSRAVARLTLPSQGLSTLVVSSEPSPDGIPAAMHQPGTPLPGEPGNSVIGDRDGRALGFLGRVKGGDLLGVQRADGTSLVYRVTDIEIIDERDVWIMKDEGPTRLTLITCYPFDAQCAGHRLRYAVIARALPSGDATPER